MWCLLHSEGAFIRPRSKSIVLLGFQIDGWMDGWSTRTTRLTIRRSEPKIARLCESPGLEYTYNPPQPQIRSSLDPPDLEYIRLGTDGRLAFFLIPGHIHRFSFLSDLIRAGSKKCITDTNCPKATRYRTYVGANRTTLGSLNTFGHFCICTSFLTTISYISYKWEKR